MQQQAKAVVSSRYQNQKRTLSKTGSSGLQANITIGHATLSERNDQSGAPASNMQRPARASAAMVRKVQGAQTSIGSNGRGSRPKSKSIQSGRQQSKGSKGGISVGQKGAQVQFSQKGQGMVSQLQP